MAGKGRDRTVYRKPDGWAEKRNDATRAAGVYKTREAAIEAARVTLHKQGGGELIIMGRDGRICGRDTITPGRDPHPPRVRKTKAARSREGESVYSADAVTVRPTTGGRKTIKTLIGWRSFEIEIELDEEGWLVGTVAELPGCHTQARTEEELIKRVREAVALALTDRGDSPD